MRPVSNSYLCLLRLCVQLTAQKALRSTVFDMTGVCYIRYRWQPFLTTRWSPPQPQNYVLISPLFSSATIMNVYPLPTLLRLGNIDKLTFWVAAILDYKMATTKIVNQSIHFPTAKNVDIATKIEFLYCLACEILSKQLLEVSILRSKMADQKGFRSNGNIGFWCQRGISFPKMYLVPTLHKIRAKIHSNPLRFFDGTANQRRTPTAPRPVLIR